MTVTLCVGASNFLWLPLMGAVSDRIGRRPLLAAVCVLALFTAYRRYRGSSAPHHSVG